MAPESSLGQDFTLIGPLTAVLHRQVEMEGELMEGDPRLGWAQEGQRKRTWVSMESSVVVRLVREQAE